MGHLFVMSCTRVRRVAQGECCLGVMYIEWCSDFVVVSPVEVFVDYSDVYVSHVCFDLICDVCGVFCDVECC